MLRHMIQRSSKSPYLGSKVSLDSVGYRTEANLTAELSQVLARCAEETESCRALGFGIRDVHPFQGKDGDVWRLSVKPGDAAEISARAEADQALFDWGGGLVWLRVPAGTDVRARLGGFSGHATLVRSDHETIRKLGRFHPEPTSISALTKGLRAKFDPRGLFNPGLMG